MKTIYAKKNALPIFCNDGPVNGPWPAPLDKATEMVALDKVGGIYVRRKHGVYSSLTATIAAHVASK